MNDLPADLDVLRNQLLDAIDHDLAHRAPRISTRLALPSIALGAVAIALGLTLTASSPPSAYASAKKALTATAATISGTITGSVSHDGSSYTLETTKWNGDSISVTAGDKSALRPAQAIELVEGDAYVEQPDGTWLQYASESGVGPKIGPMFELAHNDVAGTTADQILSIATGLTETSQADGTTVYNGTIPPVATDPGIPATDDAILRIIGNLRAGANGPGFHDGLQFQMTAGPDGLVRQISLTYTQLDSGSAATDGAYTWSIDYGQLGTTPEIAPPATSTPTPAITWSQPPACTAACGG